jgi:hypothetical protein
MKKLVLIFRNSKTMRRLLFIIPLLTLLALLTGCDQRDFSPDTYVTKAEQKVIIEKIVRYTAKLPPTANNDTKFESEHDEYYKAVAEDYDIRSYFIGKDSVHYLLVTRAARSIKPMRESIGIKLTYNTSGDLKTYEEVFRTWKMPEETMNERYPVLFELMVEGEDLSAYYPKNKGDQYIEFPDGRFYFDVDERRWRDQVMDSLNSKDNVN